MAARQLSIEGHSDIADFYKGRSIFITGATGFMGKVLVERLLSTCPGVDKLYLLLRTKKDTEPHKRLLQLKESQIFDNIRRSNPTQLLKLEAMEGDIMKPRLGLLSASVERLKEVSIVFHTAATVKFDEELKTSVIMNVLAPLRVMDIARELPLLEAFVHVSTAYCNCDRRIVEEKLYPPPADLDKLLALCDALPTELLADITEKYIGERPNTYTFTKAMGEHAVVKNSGQYPIAIFRPTIVTAALSKPFPGWVDTFTGPTGLLVGAGKGVVRTLYCRKDLVTDLLPVDMAIDTLIAVGWQTAIERSLEVKIYNCGTSELNPITWKQYEHFIRQFLRYHPFDNCLWYPGGAMQENKYVNKIYQILFQTIPAYFVDYSAWLLGIHNSISLIKLNKRMAAALSAIGFFTVHEWEFKTDNTQKLCAKLSPGDTKLFNLDPNTIDWKQYMYHYVRGTRKYALKEKDQDIVKAKNRLRKFWYLHYGLQALTLILFLRYLLKNSDTTRKLISGTTKLLLSKLTNGHSRKDLTH